MNKNIIICVVLMIIGQAGAWFQQYAHIKYPWFKENTWLLALFGFPLAYVFIYAARFGYEGFNEAWVIRIVQISVGFIMMQVLTQGLLGETLTPKTIVCIILSFIILAIQFIWK